MPSLGKEAQDVLRREGAADERARIKRVLRSTLDALIMSRDDEYGAGWNAAIRLVREKVG